MLGYMPTINYDLLNDRFDKIRFLIGDFNLDIYSAIQHNLGWIKTGEGISSLIYDSSFISENVDLFKENKKICMNNTLACDTEIDTFKLLTLSNNTGLMDVYKGNIAEGILTFCNVEAATQTETENEDSNCFKLMYKQLSVHKNELVVGYSKDKGKTWFPYLKTVYKRKNTN